MIGIGCIHGSELVIDEKRRFETVAQFDEAAIGHSQLVRIDLGNDLVACLEGETRAAVCRVGAELVVEAVPRVASGQF